MNYIPDKWFRVMIKAFPSLYTQKLQDPRKDIIGIFHLQLTTIKPSSEDYAAIQEAMRRLKVRRFVLGTGYINKKGENWFQKINFETVWIDKKC